MFDLGASELLVVMILALLLIGPKDLPRVARQLGRYYRQIRLTLQDLKQKVEQELDAPEPPALPPKAEDRPS